jgi:hypothetical protein
MPDRYRGVSRADDDDAGFRKATHEAVEAYKQQVGKPQPGKPVRLRVAEMYVEVHNPIHEFIVDLETERPDEGEGGG